MGARTSTDFHQLDNQVIAHNWSWHLSIKHNQQTCVYYTAGWGWRGWWWYLEGIISQPYWTGVITVPILREEAEAKNLTIHQLANVQGFTLHSVYS